MKFVADENVDKQIVDVLRSQRHDVIYIAEQEPGINDAEVLARSLDAGAVLITADKDFGEIVFRQRRFSAGVLLLRLAGVSPDSKAQRVRVILDKHGGSLAGAFSVLTPGSLRIRRDIR